MFSDRPNVIAADEFLNELKINIKRHTLSKYGQIDKDLPIEPQINNLVWLQEREIISKEEFQTLKSQLLSLKPNSESIGFKNSN